MASLLRHTRHLVVDRYLGVAQIRLGGKSYVQGAIGQIPDKGLAFKRPGPLLVCTR